MSNMQTWFKQLWIHYHKIYNQMFQLSINLSGNVSYKGWRHKDRDLRWFTNVIFKNYSKSAIISVFRAYIVAQRFQCCILFANTHSYQFCSSFLFLCRNLNMVNTKSILMIISMVPLIQVSIFPFIALLLVFLVPRIFWLEEYLLQTGATFCLVG